MAILDFVALVFATLAIHRAWFIGSIFQKKRAYYESLDDWWSKLLGCALCLS